MWLSSTQRTKKPSLTFAKRTKGVSETLRKGSLGSRSSMCNGPVVRLCLACWKNSSEPRVDDEG